MEDHYYRFAAKLVSFQDFIRLYNLHPRHLIITGSFVDLDLACYPSCKHYRPINASVVVFYQYHLLHSGILAFDHFDFRGYFGQFG